MQSRKYFTKFRSIGTLTAGFLDVLCTVCSCFQAIVFNFRPSDAELTGVFCQLFESLNNDLGVEYVQEALNCLIGCLEKDARCHDEWRNNYLARMKESRWVLNDKSRGGGG